MGALRPRRVKPIDALRSTRTPECRTSEVRKGAEYERVADRKVCGQATRVVRLVYATCTMTPQTVWHPLPEDPADRSLDGIDLRDQARRSFGGTRYARLRI